MRLASRALTSNPPRGVLRTRGAHTRNSVPLSLGLPTDCRVRRSKLSRATNGCSRLRKCAASRCIGRTPCERWQLPCGDRVMSIVKCGSSRRHWSYPGRCTDPASPQHASKRWPGSPASGAGWGSAGSRGTAGAVSLIRVAGARLAISQETYLLAMSRCAARTADTASALE
jgi:hypothetical protein